MDQQIGRSGVASADKDASCSPEQNANYHLRWQSYAQRRNLALVTLLAWPPVCVVLFALSRYWLHLPAVSLLLMAAWLVWGFALVWWQGEFRCPRCNRRYGALGSRRGRTNWTRGLFDRVCSNCKLRKFELIEQHPRV